MASIEKIGVDNVMIETDYPHTDSTWPNCIEVAHKELAGLSDEVKRKVMQTNASRVFNFALPEPPATQEVTAGHPRRVDVWLSLPFLPAEGLVALTLAAERAGVTGVALSEHPAVPAAFSSPYPYGGGRPASLPTRHPATRSDRRDRRSGGTDVEHPLHDRCAARAAASPGDAGQGVRDRCGNGGRPVRAGCGCRMAP